MAALFVIELMVKNADKLKEYSAQTPAILKKYKGELLLKGKASQIHASTNPFVAYDTVVIFQFPSKEDALGWYNSPEYQDLLPLRDEAMDSSFKLVV
jgi:uncharacterized protein (DUF1330 family)